MSRGFAVRARAALAAPLLALLPSLAHAESAFGERTADTPEKAVVTDEGTSTGDGVYGRLDGDFSVSPAAGGEVDFRSSSVRLLLGATVRYFSAVGPYVAYRESFEESDELERILGAGVLIDPLFLFRAVKNQERGPQFLDLTLDSLSLSIGAFWQQPEGGSFGEERGAEGGVGFGVPLAGTASGPWLRARGVGRIDEAGRGGGSLWLTLEWQVFLNLGVAAGPDLPE